MKKVPFRANHDDALHCMLATYGMVIENYTGRKLSWRELEQLCNFRNGKPDWSMKAYLEMTKMGIRIEMYDPFDYKKYLKQGANYFKDFLTEEEYAWQLEHSVMPDKQLIPEFLKKIKWVKKSASLGDIDRLLKQGRLVGAGLNLDILNGKSGLTLHEVLILKKEGQNYIIHDPGPPAIPFRNVKASLLYKAIGGQNHNQEITGFYKP